MTQTTRYIIEIALTHDHQDGARLPDYFQALLVPLADAEDVELGSAEKIGDPVFEDAEPVANGFTATGDQREQLTFDNFLAAVGLNLGVEIEDVLFSIEEPDDCMICAGLREVELVSQGRLA